MDSGDTWKPWEWLRVGGDRLAWVALWGGREKTVRCVFEKGRQSGMTEELCW